MAFSEQMVERIESVFVDKNINAEGKKFMGGYCFS